MKVTFVSNYFNHHQKPLSDALYRLTDGNYTFVSTTSMREERKKLGYVPPRSIYELPAYKNDNLKNEALRLIAESDVVIAGSTDYSYIKDRIQDKKLMFKYGERPLRNGIEPLKYLPRVIKWNREYPGNAPIYLLASSAYAAWDYARFGMFKNKTYRWAYFTDTIHYDNIDGLMAAKQKNSLLWVARFLELKHPDHAVEAVRRLINNGIDCRLAFIGIGPIEQQIRRLVEEKGLGERISFLGAMSPEQVRSQMEKAEICLFTSDKQEGWGAVVNEAMNSGCAVVGSHAAGSIPFLIKDGQNGMIYRSCDVDMLYNKTRYLLDHPAERDRMGREAYQTITGLWNAETAAERLLELSRHLINGEKAPDLYIDGPCSKTEIIKDDWM